MPAIVESAVVENCLRDFLAREGFTLSPRRGPGENGVDILATKEGDTNYYIEVIAYKSAGSTRARDFFEAFFRATSRLNNRSAGHCVIALSQQWKRGLPTRAGLLGEAWIANAFPELEIWIVEVERGSYRRTHWYDWLPKPSGVVKEVLSDELRHELEQEGFE